MFKMECLRERHASLDANMLVMLGYIVGLEVKLIRVGTTFEPRIILNNRLQLPVLRNLIREAKEGMESMEREMKSIEVSLFLSGCQLYTPLYDKRS